MFSVGNSSSKLRRMFQGLQLINIRRRTIQLKCLQPNACSHQRHSNSRRTKADKAICVKIIHHLLKAKRAFFIRFSSSCVNWVTRQVGFGEEMNLIEDYRVARCPFMNWVMSTKLTVVCRVNEISPLLRLADLSLCWWHLPTRTFRQKRNSSSDRENSSIITQSWLLANFDRRNFSICCRDSSSRIPDSVRVKEMCDSLLRRA